MDPDVFHYFILIDELNSDRPQPNKKCALSWNMNNCNREDRIIPETSGW